MGTRMRLRRVLRTSLAVLAGQVAIVWLHRPVLRIGGDAIARVLASRSGADREP